MTPPPAINHQRSSGKLFRKMADYAEDNDLGEVLEAPCGVRLPGQSVPIEPDILFIKKERLGIIGRQYVEGAPDLIVEILSPSSIAYDRTDKFRAYQKAGVSEYWLVDYEAKTVELFTLAEGNYILIGKYASGNITGSLQLAGFEIAIDLLFGF